jgi:hypothetical protein
MKKLALTSMLLFSPLALAYDPALIKNSSAPLAGALAGVMQNSAISTHYIPGFGVQFVVVGATVPINMPEMIKSAKTILTALGSTVEGLEAGDRISYANYTFHDLYGPAELVVTVPANDLQSFEVWVNGELVAD